MENTALSTWAGSGNITTVGTIGSGTWNGTTIALLNGGTGATTAAGARTNLGAAASGANTDITSVLLNQTGLVVKGATANALTIKPNEPLTAGRTLNIITGDATRTLTFTGDASISGTNTGDQTLAGLGGVSTATTVNGKALSGNITLGLASADFVNQGTAFTVLHGNAAGNPSFAAVSLVNDITGTLGIANGGTGATTKTAAFDALSPMTSVGDIIIGGAGGTGTRLAAGTNGYVLGLTGGSPQWQAAGAGDMLLGTNQTITSVKTFSALPVFSTLTLGSVPYIGAGKALAEDNANFFWDGTNHRLGIGTNAPTTPLTVFGDVTINATGSSTGTPRTIGINGWGSGNAARYTFGDPWNSIQNAYGDRMQITGYWGVEIYGNTGTASALAFAGGLGTDASLNVVGTRTAAPVLAVTSTAGQTGNIQEWRNSGGTAIATVDANGNILTSGSILSSGTGGIGYSNGSGGTITQAGNKTNGVTINKITGQITMNAANMNTGTTVKFTVTNSTVSATDVPFVAISGGTASSYLISVVRVAAGSFDIAVANNSGGPLAEALVINFAIISGSNN